MEARSYETVVVLNPNLTPEVEKKALDSIEGVLSKYGAKVQSVDKWGRLQLAHLAKKHSHGSYYCFTFDSESDETIDSLNSELNLLESVIKYQSHRTGLKGKKVKLNPNAKPQKED